MQKAKAIKAESTSIGLSIATGRLRPQTVPNEVDIYDQTITVNIGAANWWTGGALPTWGKVSGPGYFTERGEPFSTPSVQSSVRGNSAGFGTE